MFHLSCYNKTIARMGRFWVPDAGGAGKAFLLYLVSPPLTEREKTAGIACAP